MFTQRYCQKISKVGSIYNFSKKFSKSPSLFNQKCLIVHPRYQQDFYIRSTFPLHQTSLPFSTTKQKGGSTNEDTKGTNLAAKRDMKQEELKMAEDILKTIIRDYDEIYTNGDLKESSLYRELFQEGVKWSKLFSSNPQKSMGDSSVDEKRKEVCVFCPDFITQRIFEICESLRESEGKMITGLQGMGKTYSVALYVYLKRKSLNCRVFFIHNSQDLIDNPYVTFYSELERAFEEELSDLNVRQVFKKLGETLRGATKLHEEKINAIQDFVRTLEPLLEKKKIKTYVVVDEVNVLAEEQNDTKTLIAYELLNSLDLFRKARNIHVESKSYEIFVVKVTQVD